MKQKHFRFRWLWLAGIFFLSAAVLMGMTMRRAEAPVEIKSETPLPAYPVSEEGVRVSQDTAVTQTMLFSRCGHSVTRRIHAPQGVIGADFAQTQEYYDLWQIDDFSAEEIGMSREIQLFCPMHQVLTADEAGAVVLTENLYGDGMAVVKTYEETLEDFDEESREELRLGLGFDSREEAEAWLSQH